MGKDRGKISVIVPVYNMGEHLEKAVNTLLKQTYCNYEIILVDDGSTDEGVGLCDQYAEKYEVIRTIHKENGGLSSARNRGIQEAAGSYVIFPDPDDWVDEKYLESLIEQNDSETDLEVCGHYIVCGNKITAHNKDGKKIFLNKDQAILSLLKSGEYCGFAWNKLYHMDLIKKQDMRFDEELGMAQDLHFAFRYILLCDKIAYNPEPHYFYYQHEKGVTNINHPLTARKISGIKTYQKLFELAENHVPNAVPLIGATIANLNLHFLYIYYNSDMKDVDVLRILYTNFKMYKMYFFKNNEYSILHKLMGGIALINPKLYYLIRKRKLT